MRYVITGANRGIGLEFVRQLLARGETVLAGVRRPERAQALEQLAGQHGHALTVLPCDVTDAESVRVFASAADVEPVDVLINNAGVTGGKGPIDELDLDEIRRQFEVNAVGTLRVTTALLPAIRRGSGRRIVSLTSERASLANNTIGGRYPYRMSKGALNQAVRSMAVDLRPEGIICLLLHPGWVQTAMGGHDAPVPVAGSVSGLLRLIDRATLEHSGRFLDYQGREIPW